MPLVNAKNVQLRRTLEKIFDIFFDISHQSLVKGAWVFSQSVAALAVTHPGV